MGLNELDLLVLVGQAMVIAQLLAPLLVGFLRSVVDHLLVRILPDGGRSNEDRAAHHRDAPQNLLGQADHTPPVPVQEHRISLVSAAVPGALREVTRMVKVIPGDILVSIYNNVGHDAS
jgi:hypothetical protein